jgi:hypothetical protein
VTTDVFCNQCGHKNLAGSNFCSACGSPLELRRDEHTVNFFGLDAPVDSTTELSAVSLDDIVEGGATLVVPKGQTAGARYSLVSETTTAGRHPDSDIFLDDVTVSRRHAEFERRAGVYLVRDVGSLNGTYVNRQRIDECELANGDEVQIGKFRLVFFAGFPSAPGA